jgi:uncharacterized protein (DUF58 family)
MAFGAAVGFRSGGGRSPRRLRDSAEALGSAFPPLLIEARRISHTVAQGIHGRRRPGVGETFWEYRGYRQGDMAARIDWRKSARSDRLFVRENEWEAANTLWLWADLSPGMEFRSHLASIAKRERAVLLALALAALVLRAGERVGAFGSGRPPSHHRATLDRLAQWYEHALERDAAGHAPLPPAIPVSRFAKLLLISDFLTPVERIAERLSAIAARDVKGHLVQLLDPAEETLPYKGRKEFEEVRGPLKLILGRTETVRGDYQRRITAHREALAGLAARLGWSFTVHHTDQPPQSALLSLYAHLSGEPAIARAARSR